MIAFLFILFGVATACKEIENPLLSPTYYNLELSWDTNSDIFSGTVSISLTTKKIKTSLKQIVLNNDGLNIATVGAKQADGKVLVIKKYVTDESNCTLTVYLDEELHSLTKYTLDVSYSGRINNKPEGLYNYTDGSDTIALTNLYPYHARKVFPCFDKPSIKTPFDITIITNEPTVISNMPKNTTTTEKQGVSHKFNKTPAIPTYSVFFLIGSQNIKSDYDSGLNGGLYFYPSFKKNQMFTEYKDIVNVNVLKQITKEVKLPKIDVIVVPKHAEKTASSYGVVVLRNDVMEFHPDKVTSEMKKDAALAILNGAIKVFFGNLLTPTHWGVNFLSDSIVNYLKYEGLEEARGFIGLESRITEINTKTLKETWSSSVEPVIADESKFLTTDDISDFINGPSMTKGAAVISMLEGFATKKEIRDALIMLLNTKPAANITDFYYALSKQLPDMPIEIDELLDNWLFEPSYPAVMLTRKMYTVYLAEELFSFDDQSNSANPWIVPLNYATRQNPTFGHENIYWMTRGIDENIAMNFSLTNEDWIAINTNGYGPFVTAYDEQSWDILGQELRNNISTFPISMRAKIISDGFLMAEAKKLNYTELLNFLHYLDGKNDNEPNEEDLAPWDAAICGLKDLWTWIYPAGKQTDGKNDSLNYNLKQDFKNYVSDRMVKIFNALGKKANNDDKSRNILRSKVYDALCNFGYDVCLTQMSEAYIALDSVKNLGNDMYYQVVCGGVRYINGTSEWETAFKKFYNPLDHIEIQKLQLSALACTSADFTDTSLGIRKLLELLLLEEDSIIPLNMVEDGFNSIYSKTHHVTQANYFFLRRQSKFRKGIDVDMQARMLRGIAKHLSTDNHKTELETFMKSHGKMPKALKDATDYALSTLEAKQQFIEQVQHDVAIGLNPLEPTITPSVTPTTSTGSTSSDKPTNSTKGPATTKKPNAAPFIQINVYLLSFIVLIRFLV